MLIHSDADLRRVLTENASVAVVGAKDRPWEVAHRIPAYMASVGWRVVGVNPKLAGSATTKPRASSTRPGSTSSRTAA